MFNFGSAATATTPSNTSLFGTSTPVNQNRTGTSLFGNTTTTQPSALTSTPFGSTSLFGNKIRIIESLRKLNSELLFYIS